MTMAKPNAGGSNPSAGRPDATGEEIDLDIRSVGKRYGSLAAVNKASLSIRKGEIISFLGPSGCGKSTLLNMIAGFIDPDEGDIRLRGRSLINVPPHKRETGMVFQHYALFPHMPVARNIAYGLEARNQPASLIRERVSTMMSLLKLDGFENRYPGELSGGQRQRVAMARALAVQPQVLLLDEALSALDKNLREEMQIELSLLLRKLRITTIMVTHDQAEAFAISDRIAVMERGSIVQVGTPQEVYRRPGSSFVVEFLGSANRLPAESVTRQGGEITAVTASGIRVRTKDSGEAGSAFNIYVRSEDVHLSAEPTASHTGRPGKVTLVTFLGAVSRYVVDLDGLQIVVDCPPGARHIDVGSDAYLDILPESCYVLPAGGRS
jgi:ABC-type Fe3+/spermidine/putrescine transport system ATPase subunit